MIYLHRFIVSETYLNSNKHCYTLKISSESNVSVGIKHKLYWLDSHFISSIYLITEGIIKIIRKKKSMYKFEKSRSIVEFKIVE